MYRRWFNSVQITCLEPWSVVHWNCEGHTNRSSFLHDVSCHKKYVLNACVYFLRKISRLLMYDIFTMWFLWKCEPCTQSMFRSTNNLQYDAPISNNNLMQKSCWWSDNKTLAFCLTLNSWENMRGGAKRVIDKEDCSVDWEYCD